MSLEIIAPPEYIGAIIEDLNARGGRITSLSGTGIRHSIFAACPLRRLFGYATVIRSVSQGRAIHIMKFDSYQKLSQEDETAILKKIRGY